MEKKKKKEADENKTDDDDHGTCDQGEIDTDECRQSEDEGHPPAQRAGRGSALAAWAQTECRERDEQRPAWRSAAAGIVVAG